MERYGGNNQVDFSEYLTVVQRHYYPEQSINTCYFTFDKNNNLIKFCDNFVAYYPSFEKQNVLELFNKYAGE